MAAREIAFQLDAFAQAANAQYELLGDERVFDEARRAVRDRIESLRPARERQPPFLTISAARP